VVAARPAPIRSQCAGRAFASFGEVVQGRRRDGEDFLITLPVDLWSHCRVHWAACDGPSRVDAELVKTRRIAEELLRLLGLETGVRLRIRLTRQMPIGKGLSSSTADMLAVLRACQALFGVALSERCISRLLARIEPHDALHYPTSVAYNHRRGRLLAHFGYTPDYRILGVDAGGRVCTQAYNASLKFGRALLCAYDALYAQAAAAFAARDDAAIARCATRSTRLHVQRTDNAFLGRLLAQAEAMDVLGLLSTHSGTCGGFLLPGDADEAALERLTAAVAHLGTPFHTRTLRLVI
jgi:L-threonine kinase